MPVNCGVASVFRAVMDVGAPFMTPGAGTARPVRGIVRGGVRDDAGQLRRCVGCSGDTSVAPTFGGGILRRCVDCSGDTSVAPTFGGGIPRRCVGWRAVMDVGAPFMTPGAGTARPIRGIARGGVRDDAGQLRRCDGLPGDTSVAPTFWRRHPAALRRLFGRHKCRPYVLAAASCGVASVFRATQVSPLRFGGGIPRRCVGIPGDTGVAPTLGGVCGGHVVCRRVETVGRLVFPVAVTVFPDGRSLLLVTTSVNAHRLMDFRGGEETFCSTKLD